MPLRIWKPQGTTQGRKRVWFHHGLAINTLTSRGVWPSNGMLTVNMLVHWELPTLLEIIYSGKCPRVRKNRLTFLILFEIIPKSSFFWLGVNTERAWFNASVDIYPRFTQFVFEATRGGTKLSEDEGDIAIDDLALSTSQCLGKLKAPPPNPLLPFSLCPLCEFPSNVDTTILIIYKYLGVFCQTGLPHHNLWKLKFIRTI